MAERAGQVRTPILRSHRRTAAPGVAVESFLSGLGSKLADKWLATLVLPGLVFVGVALVAATLRQVNSLDPSGLARRAVHASAQLQRDGPTAILLTVAAGVLLATAAALTANWLGFGVQRLWLGALHGAVARRLIARRRRRWTEADETLTEYEAEIRESGASPTMRDRLSATRNHIALAYPGRPTWMGDRAYAADVRVWHAHGLDLGVAWPRLWLIADDASRAEITSARAAINRAATLVGWGVLYVALAFIWWPAGLAGLVVACTGWDRARAATGSFADLVEALVDLNAHQLAVAVGALPDCGTFTRDVGLEVTRRLRKGT